MIRYNLRCEKGHAFESWFQSSAAYESQEKRKLVSCPACGSVKVERLTTESGAVPIEAWSRRPGDRLAANA